MIDCPDCWPHSGEDCVCARCNRTGQVPDTPQNRKRLAEIAVMAIPLDVWSDAAQSSEAVPRCSTNCSEMHTFEPGCLQHIDGCSDGGLADA